MKYNYYLRKKVKEMKKTEIGKSNSPPVFQKLIIGILVLGFIGCILLLFGGIRNFVIIIGEELMGRPLNHPDTGHIFLLSASFTCLLLIAISIVAIIFKKQLPSFLGMILNKRLYGVTIKDIIKEQPFLLILFVFIVYLIKNIFFVIHITGFDLYILLLTLFVHIFVSNLVYRQKNKTLICLLACYSVLVFSLAISSVIYDYSFDGLNYHQGTVIQISEGWNPFFANLPEEFFWNNHYPRFIEIFASIFLSAFGNIEMGKSYNIIFLVIVFIYACKFTGKFQKNRLVVLLISIVFTANPVVLAQLFTFYVDGALGMMIIILIFACMDYEKMKNRKDLLIIVAVSIFSINTKFTGFMCGFILVGYIFKQLAAKKYREMTTLVIAGFSILLIGVVFTGYNPYIINIRDFGHPFYPIYGKETIDIISSQRSDQMTFEGFNSMHPVQRFFSLFFLENNLKTPAFNPMKLFGLTNAPNYDLRIGGFGGLFIEFCVVLIIVMFFNIMKRKAANYKGIIFPMCLLLFMTIIMPANWWARYIPYFWYLFVFLMMASDYSGKTNKKLFIVCLIIAGINCGQFLFYDTINGIDYTLKMKHFITEIKESKNTTIHVVLTEDFFKYSVNEKFKFYGIDKNIVFIQNDNLTFSNGFGHNIEGWY